MQIVSAVAIVAALAMLTTNALPAKHRNLSLKDKLALELPIKHLVGEKSGLTHTKVTFPFAPPTTNHIFTTDAEEGGNTPTTIIVTTLEGTTPEIVAITKTTATKIPSALIPTLTESDDDVPSLSTTTNTKPPVRPTYVDAALFRDTSTATTRTTVPNSPTTTTTTTTTTTSAPTVPEHAALIRQSSVGSTDYEGYFRVWDDLSPFGGELNDDLKGYPEGGFRPFGF